MAWLGLLAGLLHCVESEPLTATHRFFTRALDHGTHPSAVTTDKAPAYPRVLDELVPATCHLTEQYGTPGLVSDLWMSAYARDPQLRDADATVPAQRSNRARTHSRRVRIGPVELPPTRT